MTRTGRRPGNPGTREAILTAARDAFSRQGYAGASVRRIAAAAGVDPALVHHYFGTKDELFTAALELPFTPAKVLPQVIAGDPDGIGERLLRTFLGIWDGPGGQQGLAALRTMLARDAEVGLFREFLISQVLRRAVEEYGLPDAAVRVPLAASQLIGVVLVRYVLRLEPLAGASVDWIVATVGPTIQRYLTGELPAPGPAD
ncbi:TetR/AcrR family transcriptional regulator [Actinocatenispora rupis]|uniref:TetR family transcriptional regulator n=1 Tax=Actinocatenispora rupis TaxID=519421 RepID=A0A8J3J4M6_9ACTN|nr:TetR family transcriptional regulator [Actinocatenispora rupis]GID09328.1 TetR family transcriptional regulator [Actinocatenispora rupis]